MKCYDIIYNENDNDCLINASEMIVFNTHKKKQF